MQIDIITLFPNMFKGPFKESIAARAVKEKRVILHFHNLRDWAVDKRGTVDDKPYGGGVGMLIRPEPIFRAVNALKNYKSQKQNNLAIKQFNHVVLLDAGGALYTQKKAQELSKLKHLILICGHYEGVDYRVHEYLADEVISIGDYVLTGGEIPAMVLVDSVTRLLPGVLNPEATQNESFSRKFKIPATKSLIEHPQYTRPENYHGYKVPKILLSGNHAEIEKWRKKEAIKRTKKNRPDLLKSSPT